MSFVNITVGTPQNIEAGQQIIASSLPLRGWDTVITASPQYSGLTTGIVYTVKFRYSFDAVRFTEWDDISNFVSITVGKKDDFIIEFQMGRSGTDTTDVFTGGSVDLQGSYTQSYFDVWNFLQGTIFEEITYDDPNWNELWINLLRKLYNRNIIPEYITRGDEEIDDTDYITYWKTIAMFFALVGELGRRKIEGLTEDPDYLIEYLTQKGLFFCNSCADCLEELVYILYNIYDEFRQRGTVNISLPASSPKLSDGEMLRMICWETTDEMLFEYVPRHLSGWTMNRSSPIYRGKTGHIQLNKAPENTQDFVDLTKFVLSNNLILAQDGTKNVAELASGGVLSFYTKVDPTIGYEITFWAKFSAANTNMLTVSANAFIDTVSRPLPTVSGGDANVILDNVSMPNNSVYYFVRCIVYAKNTDLSSEDGVTELGQGENLVFGTYDTNKLQFLISNTGSSGTFINIWDLKVVPLNLPAPTVFVNSYNILNTFLNNRNSSLTIIDFEERMRRYLTPYNTVYCPFYSLQSQFNPDAFLLQNSGSYLLQNSQGRFKI